MKSKSVKKTIISYYALSLLLILPFMIPLWLIDGLLYTILYLVSYLIYMRIAVNLAVRVTVMASVWRELDAEKYATIIGAKPFRLNYSFKLNLYFATGDYQAAYNVIASALLPHKKTFQRVYGHLLLCRVCFERGDYAGLGKHLDEIDHYLQYNPKLKLPKQNKEAYEFYRAFFNADYASACALSEKSAERYADKKNRIYFLLFHQYRLAVAKRMNGDVDEAKTLLEGIREKAPKLVLSSLAQKQLDILRGEAEEEAPEGLAVTETYSAQPSRKARTKMIVMCGVGIALIIMGCIPMKLDSPRQENKDLDYIAQIENTLYDEYEEFRVLGYFNIYSDYEEKTYMMSVDSLFLVEADGRLDLHTLYRLNGENKNNMNVKDIQVDKHYVYEVFFTPQTVEFVLTEKKRDIPEDMLYYYEIDGYYFCVISISDIN